MDPSAAHAVAFPAQGCLSEADWFRKLDHMLHRVLSDLPEQGVSHDPSIRKRTMIAKGELGAVCMFSQSRFEPGQHCPAHVHESMDEVFFVESGCGTIRVDGRAVPLMPGTCVAVEAGETHELGNDGDEALVLTYFGIARD